MTGIAAPDFRHLLQLSDGRGTFEHARFTEPRREGGYCTDDMARVLVVAAREPEPSGAVHGLIGLSLDFLTSAQSPDGAYRNRRDRHGGWCDEPTLDDCWGRSLWGLGVAAAHCGPGPIRERALAEFERGARRRSPWPRAMAYGVIGAAEILIADPRNVVAHSLLADAAGQMGRARDRAWAWPEERLAYANAVLPEAMIAAGWALGREELAADGLTLLGWLLEHETRNGHLSVTPVGGAAEGDRGPAFDQQPIEVACLAEACARAGRLDDSEQWVAGIAAASAWFCGDNDAAQLMWDPDGGGGYDGLHKRGVNTNQGAESSLALLATQQHARHLTGVAT